MSDLRSVRETLLSISNPAQVLRFADDEMDKLRRQGSMYELSSRHAWLKPLLEFYTEDLEGWLKFIKGTRDKLDRKSAEFRDIQEFYKVLSVRWIQRRTRAIIDVATNLAVRKGILEDTYEAKQRYAKRCVQVWKTRKDLLLDGIRRASPTGRVSIDHREDVLRAFWEQIADEVNNEEVPKP